VVCSEFLKLTVQCDVYELLQLTAQYARVFGIQSASCNQLTTSAQPAWSSEEQGARREAASSVVLYTFTPLLWVRGALLLFDHALLWQTHMYLLRKRSSNLAAAFVTTAHRRTPVLSVF
jgi:hypothetical protein